MIRFVKNKQFSSDEAAVDPQALAGKIVMRDAGVLWEAVSQPGRVVSTSGQKLIVQENITWWNTHEARYVPHPNSEDVRQQTTCMLSSVRVVCDTVEEACALRNQSIIIERRYKQLKQRAAQELSAFDGMAFGTNEEAEPEDAPRR